MSIGFRLAAFPKDYARCAEIWNRAYPDSLTDADEVERSDRLWPEGLFRENWVCLDGDTPVGFIEVGDPHFEVVPNGFRISIVADPQDHIAAMLAHAEERVLGRQPGQLVCWCRSDKVATRDALQAAGYLPTQEIKAVRLDLDQFDFTSWAGAVDRVESQGLRLCTVADLEREGKPWLAELEDATWEMTVDMPSPYPPRRLTLEEFERSLADEKDNPRHLMFVAMDGDRIVGYSRLAPSPVDAKLVYTGMSGTRRAYRRRGVVTALKVLGFEACRRLGARHIQTENDTQSPMRELKRRFGFREHVSWRRMVKTLYDTTPHPTQTQR